MRIDSMKVIVEVVTGWDGWIRAFCNVVKLQLQYGTRNLYFSFPQ